MKKLGDGLSLPAAIIRKVHMEMDFTHSTLSTLYQSRVFLLSTPICKQTNNHTYESTTFLKTKLKNRLDFSFGKEKKKKIRKEEMQFQS
jgi:hypothetical protein